MFSKIVLCASHDQLIAGRWRFGRLLWHRVFRPDPQGLEDFGLFLKTFRSTTLYLLVDALEEDYRLEILPHVSVNERRQLLQRKLAQVYRTLPYRAAHALYRQNEGRRDDVFLFLALNNPAFLQPWVQQIEAQQSLLAGIYCLPMVSQSLLAHHRLDAAHLLLCESLCSGLRQTYFAHGRLRFSRLVPGQHGQQNPAETDYPAEIEKTRHYLISQRCISRDTVLQAVIVQSQPLRPHQQTAQSIFTQLDHARLAKRFRLDPQVLHACPELMHMHLLVSGRRSANFAPPAATRNHRSYLQQRLIHSASLLIVLTGLVLANRFFEAAAVKEAKAQQLALAAARQEQLYRETFSSQPLPPDDRTLKALATLESLLAANARLPQHAVDMTAEALAACPAIRLQRLGWQWSHDRYAVDALPATPHSPHALVLVSAEAGSFNAGHQAAEAGIRCFTDYLKADRRVDQVMFLQNPADLSTEAGPQTMHENRNPLSVLQFKLGIRLKNIGAT